MIITILVTLIIPMQVMLGAIPLLIPDPPPSGPKTVKPKEWFFCQVVLKHPSSKSNLCLIPPNQELVYSIPTIWNKIYSKPDVFNRVKEIRGYIRKGISGDGGQNISGRHLSSGKLENCRHGHRLSDLTGLWLELSFETSIGPRPLLRQ